MTSLPPTTAIDTILESDGWLQIIFNQPDRRNALSDDMVSDILKILDHVREDRRVRGISFQGKGGIFCAGGDLKAFRAIYEQGATGRAQAAKLSQQAGTFFAKIAEMPQLTVALIDGAAMAGGFGIACCCDIIATTRDAKFALTETRIGITPAQIAPYVLDRLGPTLGKRLMLTGSKFDGEHAGATGLADYVVEDADQLRAVEAELRQEIGACAPGAVAVTKSLVRKARTLAGDAFVKEAADAFADTIVGDEGREGIGAFLEKRRPDWAK